MNEGRVLPGERITLSAAHINRPQLELQLDQPADVGRVVRVTVYDKWLFQRSNPQEFSSVFGIFAGFGKPVVPPPVRDAHSKIEDGSNGILLSFLVAAVGEVPKGGERKHRRWAFGAPTNVVTCKPSQTLVTIAVGLRDEHNELAFGPTIFLPRASVPSLRHVVFVVSDPSSYEILYSNEWHHGDFIKKNRKGTPVLIDAKAADVALPTLVGGDGDGTGAPAPAGRAQPTEDITGKYEAFVSEGDRIGESFPGLMIQINAAGNAIAAWWAPPPVRVTGHGHHSVPQPALSLPIRKGEFGALLGHFEDGVYHVHWGPSDQSVDPTPQGVGTSADSPNPRAGTGRLEILSPKRLKLMLHRGSEHTVLFLEMSEPTPRWSNATLVQVVAKAAEKSSTAEAMLKARQERPIPLAFWLVVQKDFLATGMLGRLIIEHESLPKGAEGNRDRQRLRGQISDYLLYLTDVAAHADAVVAHFALLGSNMELEIQGYQKSVYDWLRKIAEDFLSSLLQRSGDADVEAVLGRLERGFLAVGVVPNHSFVYSAEFFSLGGGGGGGISWGAYGFEAHVRRGTIDGGIEREATDAEDWGRLPRKRKEFFGFFGDIGIGLEAKLKVGGASDMLSTVKFPSFQDLSPADFRNATFYVITGAALSVSAALLNGTAASSAVVVMTVHSTDPNKPSVRLVGGVDQWMTGPDPSRPNTQLIRKPRELLGPSATIASLSLGTGWMQETKPSPPAHPDQETPPERTMTAPDQPAGRAHRGVKVYFRKNSATLEGANLSALEEALAVERSLFVSRGGRASIAGHASPEGPDNIQLSQRRADHVEQVIKRSFGRRLGVSTFAWGYGDRAARNAGLIRREDLPPVPAARKQWERYRLESQGLATEFRAVMIWVNGVLAIETTATKAALGT